MIDREIKPYLEEVAEAQRRMELRRAFRRNQALGLLLVGAAILIWRLLHTPGGWLFPVGWWRL